MFNISSSLDERFLKAFESIAQSVRTVAVASTTFFNKGTDILNLYHKEMIQDEKERNERNKEEENEDV